MCNEFKTENRVLLKLTRWGGGGGGNFALLVICNSLNRVEPAIFKVLAVPI